MTRIDNTPSYLAKPARSLIIGWLLCSALVLAIFLGVGRWLPKSGALMPYLSLLPGLSLGAFLWLLYRYLGHYDEMLKSLLLKALSASAVAGIVVQLGSLTRAETTKFGQLHDAFVISAMAVAFIVTALVLKWRHR